MEIIRKIKTRRFAVVSIAGVLCAVAIALYVTSGHSQPGPSQQDMTMDKSARSAVIEAVVANVNRYYVFPDQAAKMERQLRTQLQKGDFDSVTSAMKFAESLTEALQRDTHDRHLEVRYFEKPIPELASEQEDPDDKVAELIEGQRFNFGFADVSRLRGNIGYIDLRQFGRPQHAAERFAAAMTLLGDTKALIIDLRKCGGGDPESVMLLAAYLFDKRTHLNDIYWREDNRTEERWTEERVAGKKYGETRKVYVLTSRDTFSAGEDFAYALKYAKRATVIGETTGGGAHPGSRRRLTAHFMMNVPTGRSINPVTKTDWEGVGVVPDVKASAKNALDIAQIAALKEMVAAETDPVWKGKLQSRIAELD